MMNASPLRPILVRHARYRWDAVRQQHQLVFPEGLLILNETGAAIVQLCDGRAVEEIVAALLERFPSSDPAGDVREFLGRLHSRRLILEASENSKTS